MVAALKDHKKTIKRLKSENQRVEHIVVPSKGFARIDCLTPVRHG
jgi:hypothetical protein